MQRLEFSGAVRPLYGSLGVKGLINFPKFLPTVRHGRECIFCACCLSEVEARYWRCPQYLVQTPVPLQPRTGPKVSRRLRLPEFKTVEA